jgi:two-component system chemotaxis sensor kinase CheA
MSAFDGMEDLLAEFLVEATELLTDVDNKLVELESKPNDKELLNDIFRGFHTIKGGAGFLSADSLVALCHRTETVFDYLREGKIELSQDMMDVILDSTDTVRKMLSILSENILPLPASEDLMNKLKEIVNEKHEDVTIKQLPPLTVNPSLNFTPDWNKLYSAIKVESAEKEAVVANEHHAEQHKASDTTIRVDTDRLDQVLNLAGELGLTKNRLNCLRNDILTGNSNDSTLSALDAAVSQLDNLVGNLQSAIMKTRMQPVGRLFQKYPRLVRDLSRQLGKDIELFLEGEETELDKTMIEDLNDPLVHLVRNSVDHGVETPIERESAHKPKKAKIKLSAHQLGDHILLEISDDGRGINPDVIKRKAIEKGLIDPIKAQNMSESEVLNLILLPGFSTKEVITNVSGRGVGMDVVKTNIEKLNGKIDIKSTMGQGTTISITLPLTLAIMPVLMVQSAEQTFALPLALIKNIIPLNDDNLQTMKGKPVVYDYGKVHPMICLSKVLDLSLAEPKFGVKMALSADNNIILGVDGLLGREDVMVKPLTTIKPKGISGATFSGDGSVVLVVDVEELI